MSITCSRLYYATKLRLRLCAGLQVLINVINAHLARTCHASSLAVTLYQHILWQKRQRIGLSHLSVVVGYDHIHQIAQLT